VIMTAKTLGNIGENIVNMLKVMVIRLNVCLLYMLIIKLFNGYIN